MTPNEHVYAICVLQSIDVEGRGNETDQRSEAGKKNWHILIHTPKLWARKMFHGNQAMHELPFGAIAQAQWSVVNEKACRSTSLYVPSRPINRSCYVPRTNQKSLFYF